MMLTQDAFYNHMLPFQLFTDKLIFSCYNTQAIFFAYFYLDFISSVLLLPIDTSLFDQSRNNYDARMPRFILLYFTIQYPIIFKSSIVQKIYKSLSYTKSSVICLFPLLKNMKLLFLESFQSQNLFNCPQSTNIGIFNRQNNRYCRLNKISSQNQFITVFKSNQKPRFAFYSIKTILIYLLDIKMTNKPQNRPNPQFNSAQQNTNILKPLQNNFIKNSDLRQANYPIYSSKSHSPVSDQYSVESVQDSVMNWFEMKGISNGNPQDVIEKVRKNQRKSQKIEALMRKTIKGSNTSSLIERRSQISKRTKIF